MCRDSGKMGVLDTVNELPRGGRERIYGPGGGLGSESGRKMIEKVEMRNEEMYIFHI